jgi:DNA-directed RNA polymerase specialized sigma24 family protein
VFPYRFGDKPHTQHDLGATRMRLFRGDPANLPDLLPRIAAGDTSAVRACIDRYGPVILGMARRFLRDTSAAEDALQDVFLELWQSAGKFDATLASERTYVLTIARRRLIDRLRRRKSNPPGEPLDAVPEPTAQTVQVDLVERDEQVARAASAMKQGTVKSHARRGLIRLRELMGVPAPATMSGGSPGSPPIA